MEAHSDTLVGSEEVKAGEGTHELALSFEGERGLIEKFNTCQKNPEHQMFIPVKELTKNKLPLGHRNDQKLYWIECLATRTVKLSVNYVSPRRPSQFPLSMLAGERILSVGSGFVTDVKNEIQPCPIENCTELPGPHPVFGYITITTAAHVVCDDAEAERTTVEFFYDNPGDKCGVMTCRGVKVGTVNINGDFCEMLCVTHDMCLFNRIKDVISVGRSPNSAQKRVCSLFDRFSSLKRISLSQSENEGELISIHIDMDDSSTCKDLLCYLTECDLSQIFADIIGRNILDERGLLDTSFRIYRRDHKTVKVSSCNLNFQLDITGTASMFSYNLFMDILRCLPEGPLWQLLYKHFISYAKSMRDEHYCPMSIVKYLRSNRNSWASIFNDSVLKWGKVKNVDNIEDNVEDNDMDVIVSKSLVDEVSRHGGQSVWVSNKDLDIDRALKAQLQDFKEANSIMNKYKRYHPYSHSTTANISTTNVATTNIATTNIATTNVTATNVADTNVADTNVATTNVATTLETLLKKIEGRRTKFEEYLGIPRNYAQSSFDKVRIDENNLILEYLCSEESSIVLDTQSNIPADNNDHRDNPNPWVVHISHPHGQSKMVTFGSLTDCNTGRGYYCPLYTAPTCPGSSGGPTFVLPETDDLSQIYGVPHRSHFGNMLNEGCAWTMYPT